MTINMLNRLVCGVCVLFFGLLHTAWCMNGPCNEGGGDIAGTAELSRRNDVLGSGVRMQDPSFSHNEATDSTAGIHRIVVLMNKGDYEKAVEAVNNELIKKPDKVYRFIYLRGVSYKEMGCYGLAVDDFIAYEELGGPITDSYYLLLGEVYYRLNMLDKAITYLQKQIDRNVYASDAASLLADVYFNAGDVSKAIDSMRIAIDSEIRFVGISDDNEKNEIPSVSEMYIRLSEMNFSIAKYNESMGALKKAISLNPDDAKAYYILASMISEVYGDDVEWAPLGYCAAVAAENRDIRIKESNDLDFAKKHARQIMNDGFDPNVEDCNAIFNKK